MDAESVETHVVAELLARFADEEFLALMAVDETAARRDEIALALRALEAQGRELAAMWGKREITTDEWRTAKAELAAEEETLRATLAAVPTPMVAGLDFGSVAESWGAMTLEERQEVLRAVVARVRVAPARKGLQGFDRERVTIEWREMA